MGLGTGRELRQERWSRCWKRCWAMRSSIWIWVPSISWMGLSPTWACGWSGTTSPTPGSSDDTIHHPVLMISAKVYVWAYGLESRTSILGVVVMIIGIVSVLFRLILMFLGRDRQYTSPRWLETLLLAALEHWGADNITTYLYRE